MYISAENGIWMIPPFVSQYLLCIYLLREWMWAFFKKQNIFTQIFIIPINIMCFSFYMKLF